MKSQGQDLYIPTAPQCPDNLKETGLNSGMLSEMVLKAIYPKGAMLGMDISKSLCLPFKIIEEALVFLKNEKCIDVSGGDLIGRASYKFNLTELGRRRAQDAMKLCGYVGPAPVSLEDYVDQTYKQAVTNLPVDPQALRDAFSHLVITDELFNAVGPAILSGKSIFIYGPPGTGKTSIAQAIGDFMNRKGGDIFVPYAFHFEGNIARERRLADLAENAHVDEMVVAEAGRPLGKPPPDFIQHHKSLIQLDPVPLAVVKSDRLDMHKSF